MLALGANEWATDLFTRGGVVMWPLLLLSVVGLTLVLERLWFFARTGGRKATRGYTVLAGALRRGDRDEAKRLAEADRTVYGAAARHLLAQGSAAAAEAVELQRPAVERFLPTLSTIITAAPMLGILGTVLGIIASFEVLGNTATPPDPAVVGQGIAQALLTTAAGLVVALVVLLPYNLFRVQVDRTLGRLELLAEAGAGEKRVVGSK
ncbi:MAG: MotA/TolQ/ExbB proton channel family protein [Algisphaera sp.]